MMDMMLPATAASLPTGSTGTAAGADSGASAGSKDFRTLLNALLPEVVADAANAEAAVTEALVELAQLGQRPGDEPAAGGWPIPALLARFIASPAPEAATPPATADEALPVTSGQASPVPDQAATGEAATADGLAADELMSGDGLSLVDPSTGALVTGEPGTADQAKGEMPSGAETEASVGAEQVAASGEAEPTLPTATAIEDATSGVVLGQGTEVADGAAPAARSATADRADGTSPLGPDAAADAPAEAVDGSNAADLITDGGEGDPPPTRSESASGPTLRIDTPEPTDGLRVAASTEGETVVRDISAAREASARAAGTGTSAASVQRVLDAVELLEKAPPPRYLTLELADGRLRVSVEEGQVRLELLGERGEDASRLLEDAREALEQRGFDLDRGQRDDGGEHEATAATGPHPPRTRVPAGLRL